MGPFILAWLVGEGIIVYRSVKAQSAPPGPGQLILTSGLFVILGILAQSEKARPLATTLAWGFDIAALLNLFPIPRQGLSPKSSWPPDKAPDNVVFPIGDLLRKKTN